MSAFLIYLLIPLVLGWLMDRIFGDPDKLPHPIILFGNLISWAEQKFNKGNHKILKGAVVGVSFPLLVYLLCAVVNSMLYFYLYWIGIVVNTVFVFYGLAGKTLAKEVKGVFNAVDASLEEGRVQVARIVGRDTSELNEQQIKIAALETLSENLSDGVIAPLFWYGLGGVPAMYAYKMTNTLDSMIGYKSDKYIDFGRWSAKIDDVANYIPARLTAFLMLCVSGKLSLLSFVRKYGKKHTSPNAGYPEAALAGILNCRFGGGNFYFGKFMEKPYIGKNERNLTHNDMQKSIRVNFRSEILMIAIMIVIYGLIYLITK